MECGEERKPTERLPFIPYGRQWIETEDILAVEKVLGSEWLTQGPAVEEFEDALCATTGAKYAVAVSSGTAALHLAVLALGMQPGDHGITSAITFAASANCMAYAAGQVHFADVDPDTALMDLAGLQEKMNTLVSRGKPPKIVIPVNMAGQCADLAGIRRIVQSCGAKVIEDAAHSLGGTYQEAGQRFMAGGCAHSDMSVLSFHPVKHITTGEGGAVLTNEKGWADRVRDLRRHGIHKDPARLARPGEGPWYYEQDQLGFNYRLTDIQCALGLSQLAKLERFLARRREIAAAYDRAFTAFPLAGFLQPMVQLPGRENAYHLYIVRMVRKFGEDLQQLARRRKDLYLFLHSRGILVQVHYIPVNWHPYYRKFHQTSFEDCPAANGYYAGCLSLPIHPRMTDADTDRVIETLQDWVRRKTLGALKDMADETTPGTNVCLER